MAFVQFIGCSLVLLQVRGMKRAPQQIPKNSKTVTWLRDPGFTETEVRRVFRWATC